ncbi:hypothetical protein PAXRUDRAFT_27247 [Paxillus rubicundulus Ve08.2h10]|uniref:Uncharacterized protein n=1 Tax=Paxillus rubicundulus Ve08.2h10 TaxID=930991 RepID=A0A0D0E254_9AGAM|nr:hypothetical protein PAXRUDRAFT_27247 [Paxillus rubicundulus Ve08.2h10]
MGPAWAFLFLACLARILDEIITIFTVTGQMTSIMPQWELEVTVTSLVSEWKVTMVEVDSWNNVQVAGARGVDRRGVATFFSMVKLQNIRRLSQDGIAKKLPKATCYYGTSETIV